MMLIDRPRGSEHSTQFTSKSLFPRFVSILPRGVWMFSPLQKTELQPFCNLISLLYGALGDVDSQIFAKILGRCVPPGPPYDLRAHPRFRWGRDWELNIFLRICGWTFARNLILLPEAFVWNIGWVPDRRTAGSLIGLPLRNQNKSEFEVSLHNYNRVRANGVFSVLLVASAFGHTWENRPMKMWEFLNNKQRELKT